MYERASLSHDCPVWTELFYHITPLALVRTKRFLSRLLLISLPFPARLKSLPFVAHLFTNRLSSHSRQSDILANDLLLHFTKIWSCKRWINRIRCFVTHIKLLAWRNSWSEHVHRTRKVIVVRLVLVFHKNNTVQYAISSITFRPACSLMQVLY